VVAALPLSSYRSMNFCRKGSTLLVEVPFLQRHPSGRVTTAYDCRICALQA
jgi:hypothetical protein